MVRVFDVPIIVHDQSLDRVLAAPLPVMLVFWKNDYEWTSFESSLTRLAQQDAGELIVARIDIKNSPKAASRFDISRTPFVVGMKGGKPFSRGVLTSADGLMAHADYLLERGPAPIQEASPDTASVASRVNGAPGLPVDVTDATFEREVLKSSTPVVVDFWAAWCGPCRQIAPVVSSLAGEYAGRVKFAKVNVDQNAHFAGQYGVQGIPTLLIFKDGQMVRRLVGVRPASELRAELNRL